MTRFSAHSSVWALRLLAVLLVGSLLGCASPAWVTLAPNSTQPPAVILNRATSLPATGLPPATSPQPTVSPEPPAAAPARLPVDYLVLISLDGFRPDYLSQAAMPNLESLISAGTSYSEAWVGALENNTPTGHTMMSTGVFPRRNGIPGYSWADYASGEYFEPTTKLAVLEGEMAAVVERSGAPTLAGLVKARYPEGIVAAVSAGKYYAAQGLGMGPSDFILYTESDGTSADGADIMRLAAVNGRRPADAVMKDARLRAEIRASGDNNAQALRIAQALFESYTPRALLVHLPDTDTIGHSSGGKDRVALRAALETTDRALGALVAAYREAGLFERTLWVIAADHGMTAKADVITYPEVFGAINYQPAPKDALSLPEIRLSDHTRAAGLAEEIAALQKPGISGVYARVGAGEDIRYQPAPSTAATLPPALDQAYRYLLDTFAGAYSPDVVVMSSGNTAFDKRRPSPGGSHNMINWADQHITLAFSGPQVSAGLVSSAPARLVDLLPTIARLMELPEAAWDGVVLADALENPSAQDAALQAAHNQRLAPLRDALEATK